MVTLIRIFKNLLLVFECNIDACILHIKTTFFDSLTPPIAGCLKILSNIQCKLHSGVITVPGDVSELRSALF